MITITQIEAFVPQSDFRYSPRTLWANYCRDQKRKHRKVPVLNPGGAAFFLSKTEMHLAAVFQPFSFVARKGTKYEAVRGGQTSCRIQLDTPFSFLLLHTHASKMGLKLSVPQYKRLEEWWCDWKTQRNGS